MNHAEYAKLCVRAYQEETHRYMELEYLVDRLNDEQVIAIRGTEAGKFFSGGGWRDVLRDLLAFPWFDGRIGWAHAGVLWGAQGIFKEVTAWLPVDQPVTVVGHSLGAGVGAVLVLLLRNAGYKADFIGFGCPKVFIEPKRPARTFFHYRLGDDPVSRVPVGYLWQYKITPGEIQLGVPDGKDHLKEHSIHEYVEAMT